ncbi:MAG: patatin-like phospholipase family protein [Acidimicrobiia bacterium]|nr:patatin-like phospholipase family protein [Acidimicrobiia bacterium]
MTGAGDVAFVFPAGGSAGAAQVGILRALFAAGLRPDVVVGCSVGALNATFLALDPSAAQVDRMADIWMRLRRRDVFGTSRVNTVSRLMLRRDHLYDAGPLHRLIAGFCPIDDLADTAVPLHVVTTDLDHAVPRWWTTGPAGDVLYGSACLPGLFRPVMLDGSRHVDGGVLDPVPVCRAVDTGVRTVYVLGDVDGPGRVPQRRMTALDVLLRSFAVRRYGALPDPAALARPGQRVIAVPGADSSGLDLRDFSQTRRLIVESELLARRYLAELLSLAVAC